MKKVGPALKFHHEAHGSDLSPEIERPLIKLLLEGAIREAAERKGPIKKADSLDKEQVHKLVRAVLWPKGPGVVDGSVNLSDWRTLVRLYTYYKTFCRQEHHYKYPLKIFTCYN